MEPVLRRCLAKDPDERWQSAADLRWALGAHAGRCCAGGDGSSIAARLRGVDRDGCAGRRSGRGDVGTAANARAGAAVTALLDQSAPDSEFTFIFPGAAISRWKAAGLHRAARGAIHAVAASLDSLDARVLPGTEAPISRSGHSDGKSIAFHSTSERRLKRVEALGGTPETAV